ncbi:unnamed protein product, partial [Heterotrigona itama]
ASNGNNNTDTEKIASALNAAWFKCRTHESLKLRIMAQVNTGNKDKKRSTQACSLVQRIIGNCKSLEFLDLMITDMFRMKVH